MAGVGVRRFNPIESCGTLKLSVFVDLEALEQAAQRRRQAALVAPEVWAYLRAM